ncbi:DnaJ-domain-containing protein [Epithele typhae]|uniref:DnaJ-domain-containing protein n=1 Tax=Epithele typhae TaxID=378194 RepID=UPI002008DA8C|nr:DnaJ-domain-containing protein [Epithele typhae]KAH9941173.1 DnaJ-domain-containing protein [Epithele typhae]
MAGLPPDAGLEGLAADEPEYLYSVLNLPKTAADQEVRERYRQLSIVFHPDKQTDPAHKDAAAERFLQVQKAYEGPEGLQLVRTADFASVPEDEFERQLRRQQLEADRLRVEQALNPKGSVTVVFDVSSIIDDHYLDENDKPVSLWQNFRLALQDVTKSSIALRHSIRREINKNTLLILSNKLTIGKTPRQSRGAIIGTVQHQYSPRLRFQATTSLLALSGLGFKASYKADNYVLACESQVSRAFLLRPSLHRSPAIPPVTVSYAQRLFPNSNTQGTLAASLTGAGPRVVVGLSSSEIHDSLREEATDEDGVPPSLAFRPPSVSGLSLSTNSWNVELDLAGLQSGVGARYSVSFMELGVELQAFIRQGLNGVVWLLGGQWTRGHAAVGASVSVSAEGVVLNIDASHFGQTLSLPIVLSHMDNDDVAVWTAVVPSVVLGALYYFRLRPRRRKERLEFIRAAHRRLQGEKSEILRQYHETVSLLRDVAARHTRTEAACDGLVVQEAVYGPSERDEGTEGLDVDVTVPLQALVNASQLYIPGKRSKVGIPGFLDPVPGVPKSLRIRYNFHGREHYAEVPDHRPVVLPLKGAFASQPVLMAVETSTRASSPSPVRGRGPQTEVFGALATNGDASFFSQCLDLPGSAHCCRHWHCMGREDPGRG